MNINDKINYTPKEDRDLSHSSGNVNLQSTDSLAQNILALEEKKSVGVSLEGRLVKQLDVNSLPSASFAMAQVDNGGPLGVLSDHLDTRHPQSSEIRSAEDLGKRAGLLAVEEMRELLPEKILKAAYGASHPKSTGEEQAAYASSYAATYNSSMQLLMQTAANRGRHLGAIAARVGYQLTTSTKLQNRYRRSYPGAFIKEQAAFALAYIEAYNAKKAEQDCLRGDDAFKQPDSTSLQVIQLNEPLDLIPTGTNQPLRRLTNLAKDRGRKDGTANAIKESPPPTQAALKWNYKSRSPHSSAEKQSTHAIVRMYVSRSLRPSMELIEDRGRIDGTANAMKKWPLPTQAALKSTYKSCHPQSTAKEQSAYASAYAAGHTYGNQALRRLVYRAKDRGRKDGEANAINKWPLPTQAALESTYKSRHPQSTAEAQSAYASLFKIYHQETMTKKRPSVSSSKKRSQGAELPLPPAKRKKPNPSDPVAFADGLSLLAQIALGTNGGE